jgi:hypothetical protein
MASSQILISQKNPLLLPESKCLFSWLRNTCGQGHMQAWQDSKLKQFWEALSEKHKIGLKTSIYLFSVAGVQTWGLAHARQHSTTELCPHPSISLTRGNTHFTN